MSKTVSLADVADALDMQSDMSHVYLDRETGEIHQVPDEYLSAAEDDEDDLSARPDWERELIDLARAIVEDTEGRYAELPDQFEIDEYRLLASFADSYPDPSRTSCTGWASRVSGTSTGPSGCWRSRANGARKKGSPMGKGPRRVTPGREAVPEALVVGSHTAYHPRSTLAHARKEET